jgi:hypothetical protein
LHEALQIADQPHVCTATAAATGGADPVLHVGLAKCAGRPEAAEPGRFTSGDDGVEREGGEDLGAMAEGRFAFV